MPPQILAGVMGAAAFGLHQQGAFRLRATTAGAWHQDHAVPNDVSWDTLADLGRHMRLYRRRTGSVGLDVPWWIGLHFRGALFALGRLQFNPYRLNSGPAGPLFWYDAQTVESLGDGFRTGDLVLGVHIPESGPLRPPPDLPRSRKCSQGRNPLCMHL